MASRLPRHSASLHAGYEADTLGLNSDPFTAFIPSTPLARGASGGVLKVERAEGVGAGDTACILRGRCSGKSRHRLCGARARAPQARSRAAPGHRSPPLRAAARSSLTDAAERMIPKSGYRFSDKIMRISRDAKRGPEPTNAKG